MSDQQDHSDFDIDGVLNEILNSELEIFLIFQDKKYSKDYGLVQTHFVILSLDLYNILKLDKFIHYGIYPNI